MTDSKLLEPIYIIGTYLFDDGWFPSCTRRSVVLRYARQLLFPDGQPSEVAEVAPLEAAEGDASGTPLAEKRVSNRKLDELGVKLKFPTFREGLSAIHERNLTPFV